MEKLIWLIVCLACAVGFGIAGLWAFKSSEPVHFLNGKKVYAEDFKNVAGYNKANAIMWLACCGLYIVIAVAGLIDLSLAMVLMILSFMPGMLALIVVYDIIYKKYRI